MTQKSFIFYLLKRRKSGEGTQSKSLFHKSFYILWKEPVVSGNRFSTNDKNDKEWKDDENQFFLFAFNVAIDEFFFGVICKRIWWWYLSDCRNFGFSRCVIFGFASAPSASHPLLHMERDAASKSRDESDEHFSQLMRGSLFKVLTFRFAFCELELLAFLTHSIPTLTFVRDPVKLSRNHEQLKYISENLKGGLQG